MKQENVLDVTLTGAKDKEGIELKMTLADAFGVAARVREVEPKVQLTWATPAPFNGQISVVF
ncbi:MAG: hypothetical protein Q7R92_02240 [bacterium]|nr:hypothetical protein [bacterium]